MKKFLCKNINWDRVSYVGFDLDGTLYDEYDFVIQPYKEISKLLKNGSYSYMCFRWLEKGSSYDKIFEEAYQLYGESNLPRDKFIEKSLHIFRNIDPRLFLSNRVSTFLTFFKEHYNIFLVTDGNPILQRKKYKTLGLDRFFETKNVIFTGEYSVEYEKPHIKSLELLEIDPKKTVFFGDRDKDSKYAKLSGMQFQKVYNMYTNH